jgi:ubiquinone biosynthesis UbiH/UbiF/VisC/COQ6 family hydroxylase
MNREFDVVIVGAGLVGASLALGLAEANLHVALIEPQEPRPLPEDGAWDVRLYAVSPGNARFLARLDAWDMLPAGRIARIESMHVFGDRLDARLEFSAYEAGLRELAFIVENRLLQDALWRRMRSAAAISVFCPARCTSLTWEAGAAVLQLDDGTRLKSKLIVGADGTDSWVRQEAGIASQPISYGQLGVVANFEVEKPHRGRAYQWFRGDSVFALLPMAGRRVSMVWSTSEGHGRALLELSEETLCASVQQASAGMLGAMALIGAPAAFPLQLQRVAEFVRPRLALVGDAAHNVHPLAGQGVNLGFRDARELVSVLLDRGPQQDCGDYALLRRYERARREDVLALEVATDGLQRLFARDNPWVAAARNLGLNSVNAVAPLKQLLVQRAVA